MAWRQTITHNLSLKLAAVLLAVVAYVLLRSGVPQRLRPAGQRLFPSVQIVVLHPAADSRVLQVEPSEVAVTVAGDPALLQGLRAEDVKVFVDLTTVISATGLWKQLEAHVPPNVTVAAVDPPKAFVRVVPVSAGPKLKP
jgi:hypothetical protein